MQTPTRILAVTLILALPALALAEKGGSGKGPSDSAWEHASDKSSFKRRGEDPREYGDRRRERHEEGRGEYGDENHEGRREERYEEHRGDRREGSDDRRREEGREGRREESREGNQEEGRAGQRTERFEGRREERFEVRRREEPRQLPDGKFGERDEAWQREQGFRWPWQRRNTGGE
jgi:hypothetical protein